MSSSDGDLLQSALAALRVGIVCLDAKGRVELQNQEASRILGASAAATLGRTLAEVLGPQHPAVRLAALALESDREVAEHGTRVPQRLGDSPLSVDLAVAPFGEDRPGLVLTLHDRTIKKELEELVDQRLRADVYAQLASGIAHEIRNPLGGIRGTAELLESKLPDPALAKYPKLIREETDRIKRLLDDLAELTRGGDLRPRRMNLHEVLDKLITLQQRSAAWKQIDVRREYDPSIPDVELDPDRITQVFLNLCRNAVQAMDGHGQLTLRTRVETIYQLAPVGSGGGRHHMVRIDVEDTGPGIPEELLPHVFTPFFTRREGGTGLGLPIAQQWVVRHGGQIQVAAGHAGGTRVRVLLPFKRIE
jgi:two-component system nitrogen regulation sensor histidine kinase GlnL